MNDEETHESDWKIVNFARKLNYTYRNSTITINKATTVAAQPQQQLGPGTYPNPTRPYLGRIFNDNYMSTKPNKDLLNKFKCLANFDPIRGRPDRIGLGPNHKDPNMASGSQLTSTPMLLPLADQSTKIIGSQPSLPNEQVANQNNTALDLPHHSLPCLNDPNTLLKPT